MLSIAFTSCKPYQEKKYVDVDANSTAYVIPLETGSKENQTKMKSEAYYEQNKVAVKRIYIPTQWHETGRMAGDGEWIPSIKVIIVNRTPVTREWSNSGTGTNSKSNEALLVESKESIGFFLSITCTGSIPEESASKFLYSYSGKTLAKVMDEDVRGYVLNILTTEFGKLSLTECQGKRSEIFDYMRKNVTEHFVKYGINIVNIGSAGGFTYQSDKIQDAIDSKYSSEMKITSANNEVIAAQKFVQAKNAIIDQKMLDADIAIKTAFADAVRAGKLNVPSTIAGGNINLMELYGLKSLSGKK